MNDEETVIELRTCKECAAPFQIMSGDIPLLERFEMPLPTLCFDCRLLRRLAFYNRRRLYRRTCDLSGKPIVSMFPPDSKFTVYDKDLWYSDGWDPLSYGRDFDFSRPFFEQFHELMLKTPYLAVAVVGQNENSDFTNDNQRLKNCYLTFDCANVEDTLYGELIIYSKDCMDILSASKLELCYECTGCQECYNLKYSRFCKGCYDSWFLKDCIGCSNCFGCTNLHQKQYHLFNRPHTKDEYEAFLHRFDSGDYITLKKMQAQVEEFYLSQPVRATRGVNSENIVGEHVNDSKNAYQCFNGIGLEDCRYCTDIVWGAKNCMDIHCWGDRIENCYNSNNPGEQSSRIMCSCFVGVGCSDVYYSHFCTRNCSYLFGCIGLQKKQYCILNKQYSPEEYKLTVKRIIEHMRATEEWGEFFPPEISPFGYNESMALEHYPRTRDQVVNRGWKWSDYVAPLNATRTLAAADLPSHIDQINDEVLNWAIICEATGKPFKIVSKELAFYRAHRLPLPRRHSDQRHVDRFILKNPYQLCERSCAQCHKKIQSSYAPERKEIVLCVECYQQHMF
jgi:hypothetical protein